MGFETPSSLLEHFILLSLLLDLESVKHFVMHDACGMRGGSRGVICEVRAGILQAELYGKSVVNQMSVNAN